MGVDVNASFSLLNDSKWSVVHLKGGKLLAKGGSLTLAHFLGCGNRPNQVMQWAGPFSKLGNESPIIRSQSQKGMNLLSILQNWPILYLTDFLRDLAKYHPLKVDDPKIKHWTGRKRISWA